MFVFLLLCFCFDYVCGASDEANHRDIVLGGKRYFAIEDRESIRNGFGYARAEGATAQGVLQDVYAVRKDPRSMKVYRGHEVDREGGTTSETVHFSVRREYTLSVTAARSFLHRYGLEGGYFCVGLEDLADFSLFLDSGCCVDGLKVGLPPTPDSCQEFPGSAYEFGDALRKYRDKSMTSHIVFFSSGRRGFVGAGEFFFQLERCGLTKGATKVSVFFTALKEQEYLDAREEIAFAAYTVAGREGLPYWQWVVDQYVEHVGCQRIHKGQVRFMQDEGNILTSWWFDEGPFTDKKGKLDVLVGWPSVHLDDRMAPYLARAYRLYSILNKVLGAGCITGQENPQQMPDKTQHTLVCIGIPSFDFAQGFGEKMQITFGYKNVEFVESEQSSMKERSHPLIVGGSVKEDKENIAYFDVLVNARRDRFGGPLQGYERSIVIKGRVYERILPEGNSGGFVYTPERGGTAEALLQDIARAKKDVTCEAVYCGMREIGIPSKLSPIMHMSVGYERALSERAVRLLLDTYGLQDVFLCTSFEDFSDFCGVEQLLCGGGVHVSTPKRLCAGERFVSCFNTYRPGQPIVFCASGRGGFASAGEFFSELCRREDVCAQNPRLYFLFSAISGEEYLQGCDGGRMILRAAHYGDYSAQFHARTACVAIARFYEGKITFAQDRENMLVGLRSSDFLFQNLKPERTDVLVPYRGKDAVSVAYRQCAYRLFEHLRFYGAGCVTGEEGEDQARSERTLLCVTSVLFDGAEGFGRSVAKKLHYQDIKFASCDDSCAFQEERLVATGGVEQGFLPETLTVWPYGRS